MAIRKKKGQCGIVKQYVTRQQALRTLQISLQDFLRLCILKGIYPREPKHRVKAQKGDSRIKTLYLKSDINFLLHEPLIWTFREEKIRRRKLITFREKKEKQQLRYLENNPPEVNVDHMVLERYPSFKHALEDLGDALSTCFLFATLHASKEFRKETINLCRKVSVEFLMFVIESRTLVKAFVTMKGYYYRAEIQGVTIDWIIPHPFPVEVPNSIEPFTMIHSIKFYTTLLSFVNCKLYQSINLFYPIKLIEKLNHGRTVQRRAEKFDLFYSLNRSLRKTASLEENEQVEEYDKDLMRKAGVDVTDTERRLKLNSARKKLFEGHKFFLGREINRESLTFVIRAAGGEVSWDESLGRGYTFQESDSSITHHIVDRPVIQKKNLRRYYIQPQWVYDCFNFAIHLPVQEYFVGTDLPPHLSPFEETYDPNYTPPEMLRIHRLQESSYFTLAVEALDEEEQMKLVLEEQEKLSSSSSSEDEEGNEPKPKKVKKTKKKKKKVAQSTEDALKEADKTLKSDDNEEDDDDEANLLKKMKVVRGRVVKRNLMEEKSSLEKDTELMASKLIHRKQKRLYNKLVDREKLAAKKTLALQKRRKIYDDAVKKKQKRMRKSVIA